MQRVPSLKGVLIEYACSCTLRLTTRGVYTRTTHPRKPNSGKGMKVVVVGLDTLTYLGAASREEIDTRGAVQDPANLPITMTNKIIRVFFFFVLCIVVCCFLCRIFCLTVRLELGVRLTSHSRIEISPTVAKHLIQKHPINLAPFTLTQHINRIIFVSITETIQI
jgi:hypothetical protein